MMHQQFSPSVNSRRFAAPDVVESYPLSMLVYRSRAVVAPTEAELEALLRQAQARNQAESVTGLLIYDQGSFYQWLEGPGAALARIWHSIKHDPRHCDIEILREQLIAKRHYGSWNMRLVSRTHGRFEIPLPPSRRRPAEFMDGHRVQPKVFSIKAWDQILDEVVIPGLKWMHRSGSQTDPAPGRPAPLIWHPRVGAVRELAETLRSVDTGAAGHFINGLVSQGASLEALYQEVFEPAARFLGGLWYEDRCDDVAVTLAMGRLQFLARRLSEQFGKTSQRMRPGHAVLVVPQPGELHMLGVGMASELFWRAGWDVSCEFPGTDAALQELVHENWFDVLELSLSTALRHEHRLQHVSETIQAVQNTSKNPAVVIVVDGRVFVERPGSASEVGANAGCVSVVDCVPQAERLLTAIALRTPS
jgi:hypothetical protein